MPSYKTAFGSFLKQEDVPKPTKVIIESVGYETLKNGDEDEEKLVARFVGQDKGLVLNRTNCESLEEILQTDDYDAWAGNPVVLWTDPTVKFGGKTVGGLRIRAVSAAAKPAPKFVDSEEPPF
jgi:hypothetical protein